ncbi:MAG: transglycosylase SLT domain-containing protein [Deltaproteobacteria bacterium]|nr:transglycosylase SLT domain-containing protein [Deltaproteobacteria bacterium]
MRQGWGQALGGLLVLPFLMSCASPEGPRLRALGPEITPDDDVKLVAEIEREIQSPTLKTQALRFSQFVEGLLGAQASGLLIQSCRGASSNPFCPSIRERNRWASFQHKRLEEPPPFIAKIITAFPLQIEKGRITNWKAARTAEKQSLLKSYAPLPVEILTTLSAQALEEKRCPNMPAVAAAATLEDFFPDPRHVLKSAQLYEWAARCLRGSPIDRENFLVRAALLRIWQKDYPRAIRILSGVRPTDAFSGRPLYWHYRLLAESGDHKRAQAIYHRLRNQYPFAFHSLVAASENGEDGAVALLAASRFTRQTRSGSQKLNSIIHQAEVLRSFNFDAAAAVLIDWALSIRVRKSGALKVYLADLGDFKTKVNVVPELLIESRRLLSRTTLELAYPRAFSSLFERYADHTDPYLLMAIAHKESKFDPLAQSPANARGLMQLSWAGRGFLILANYNAGEEPVQSWLRRYTMEDPLLFIDLIPYRETRDYVGYVLTNYYWYRRLYGSGPVAKVVAPDIARR